MRRTQMTARGEVRRASILAAAALLFADQGYRGTSLASIAASVDMTQPGVLHHFPSKESMLLALLDERYHVDGRRLAGGLTDEGLQLLRALAGIVEHNQNSREDVKLFTVLVAESISAEHPAHGHFVERYRKVRRRMGRVLRVGQASGEIRQDVDLKLLVPIIVAVMDGLQNQWLLDPEIDMLASFELFAQLLVAGIRAGDSGVADVAAAVSRVPAASPDG